MSGKTRNLKKDQYAYSSHSLLLAGDIQDVFLGKWQDSEPGARALIRYPVEAAVEGGTVMCIIKLRRPIALEDYREVHHPNVRPMVVSSGGQIGPKSEVVMVMLPAEMVSTFPDYF